MKYWHINILTDWIIQKFNYWQIDILTYWQIYKFTDVNIDLFKNWNIDRSNYGQIEVLIDINMDLCGNLKWRGGLKHGFLSKNKIFFVYPGIFHCGLVCKIRIWFCFFSIMLFDPPYQGVKKCIFALQVIFEKGFKWHFSKLTHW